MIDRRDLFIATAAASVTAALPAWAQPSGARESRRPPRGQRRFVSRVVEREIARVKRLVGDPELAWMFENCYPNTLDTTVRLGEVDGKPDTFVITGDIDAMWLRDSSAQVQPYLHLARQDPDLRRLFQGVIARQARCILIDSYANAFTADPTATSNLEAKTDQTEMKPGVAERKWEVDSLCYPLRLAHGYWQATRDKAPFDDRWQQSVRRIVATFREQQRKDGPGPYRFLRNSPRPTESLLLDGYGAPTAKVGLIHSMFRPSDDATTFPFLIPSNLFAVSALRRAAVVLREACGNQADAAACEALATEVDTALRQYGTMPAENGERVWAFEVDGFGTGYFMDDANVPSLSGLAYLGCVPRDDAMWRRTEARAWSAKNPYFFAGKAAQGIGGPHIGLRQIWPMSIIMRAMNSDDDAVIRQCLQWLKATHAGTGFIHESFDQDNPTKFTRSWFAWANGLFGELIVDLSARKPKLLAAPL